MEELETLREQKMEALKKKLAEQQAKQEQLLAAEQQLEEILKRLVEPKAKERLANVKLVNRNLYYMTVQHLMTAAKTQGFTRKLTDLQVKQVLQHLAGKKREIKIQRK
jgi:programmed cell death protein 5